MRTVIVSGASGVVGYGALRSLRKAFPDVRLIGTSIHPDSVAPAFCDVFELAPKSNEPDYIPWLIDVIIRYQADMIIPGIEIDMLGWSQNRDQIAASGTKILLNRPDLVALCGDKWAFYERLGAHNSVAIPTRLNGTFDEIVSAFGLPFLLKPRAGFASKGIVRVETKEMFDQHRALIGPVLMVQPIVGTDEAEYTTSAFFTTDSTLCAHMTLRRRLARDGYTEKAYVDDLPGVEDAIQNLSSIFHPIGPTNFQFRREPNGELKLLEINPRISSSTAIRTAFGYNEAAMSVRYFLDGVVPSQPVITRGHAVRYTEEHIFYDRVDI